MNTIIKIGLGIALALPLSAPITTGKNAYGIVEAPSSFSSLRNISPKDLVPQSPLSGEQLDAIQGMAGICISCLGETTIDRLVQTLRQRGKFSVDVDDVKATLNKSNQFIVGGGPLTQSHQTMVNQTIINQAFSPSRERLSVVGVQQIQTLAIQFPNEQQATNLAQEISTLTREIINKNLSQLQLAREIIISTQEIINQAAMNGAVKTTTINQQFTNLPGGVSLR